MPLISFLQMSHRPVALNRGVITTNESQDCGYSTGYVVITGSKVCFLTAGSPSPPLQSCGQSSQPLPACPLGYLAQSGGPAFLDLQTNPLITHCRMLITVSHATKH